MVEPLLDFLPTSAPKIKDFLPFSTEPIRESFADVAWRAYANANPHYCVFVNFIYAGGFVKGDRFLNTMRHILREKIHPGQPTAEVLFSDLPMECAIIAADTHAKELRVYSKKTTPQMEVAEAVRRSMSIPLLFEPRKQNAHEIMDGGLVANYAYWLLSEAGQESLNDYDPSRKRFGFILQNAKASPSAWGCQPPKFQSSANRARVPSPMEGLLSNIGLKKPFDGDLDIPGLERALRLYETIMATQQVIHESIALTLMQSYDYYEVNIPVRGYSWLDFQVSEEPETFLGLANRGWNAVFRYLTNNNLLSPSVNKLINQYPKLKESPYQF